MKDFNAYGFRSDLQDDIINEVSNNNLTDYDAIQEYIHHSVENACIYYADCWAIAYELGDNDFENPITGETCKGIVELAFYTLLDYVQNTIDVDKLITEYA